MTRRASTCVFVPCRAGSVRVKQKNTRPFAGRQDGLLGIKLDQLAELSGIDQVVLDSNDPEVLEIGERHRAQWPGHSVLSVRTRPDGLGRAETTTDELIAYALRTVDAELLLWTHVTSPLCGPAVYERALAAFATRDETQFDSLMSVTALRSFLWSVDGPLNYHRRALRWPHTQSLDPLFEINSAIFLVPLTVGRALGDRIGEHPMLWPLSGLEGLDVDWEDDFTVAEACFRAANG